MKKTEGRKSRATVPLTILDKGYVSDVPAAMLRIRDFFLPNRSGTR
jgi:hypothetical protein